MCKTTYSRFFYIFFVTGKCIICVTNFLRDKLNLSLLAAIVHVMKRFFHKHNAFLATALSLVLVMGGSLQLVHDQLLDHVHDVDCAMYVVDGNGLISSPSSSCGVNQQAVETTPLSPLKLVLSQLEKQQARAPPFFL